MAQRFLKPAEGANIPRPDQFYRALSKDGEWVPDNLYYRRRLEEGSCVEVKEQSTEIVKEGDEQ